MGRPQAQHDGIFVGRCLKFEVEAAAEALAQGQPPGAIQATAKRRVKHQVHAPCLIEKTLHDEGLLRGNHPQRSLHRVEIIDDLARRRLAHANVVGQVAERAPILQPGPDRLTQPRDRQRKLVRAGRCLADPKRNARRGTLRILDPHFAWLDPQDAIRHVPELKNVAWHALDGEVFVQRANPNRGGLEQHLVVGVVRDGAAGSNRRKPRSPSPTQLAIHRIVVNVGAAPSARGVEPLTQHLDEGVEVATRQSPVRPRATQHVVERVFLPIARTERCDHLLRRNVERLRGNAQLVELTAAHRIDERGGLHQFVAAEGKQPTFRLAAEEMARASNPLHQGRDGARRAELAHQIDVPHVDPQFEGGRRHQATQLAALQAPLGIEAMLAGQASMMRRDEIRTDALAQIPGKAFGHAPRVNEHERGAVLLDQPGKTIVNLLPHLATHDRFDGRRRHFDGEIEGLGMPSVNDVARRLAVDDVGSADQKARDLLDGVLRSRQPDPNEFAILDQGFESLEGQGQVASALVADKRVDLVDDDRTRALQHATARLTGQQDVERLRGRHENVWWPLDDGRALRSGCVAGAHKGSNRHRGQAALVELGGNPIQRLLQVALDVVAERFERRHVDDVDLIFEFAVDADAHQLVDGREKRRQGLARSRRGRDQRVLAPGNGRPPVALRRRRLLERAGKPIGDRGVKACQCAHRTRHVIILNIYSAHVRDRG